MSIVTIEYEFYNRNNPKCRACKDWKHDEERKISTYGCCINKYTKAKSKNNRLHNSKACKQFSYCDINK